MATWIDACSTDDIDAEDVIRFDHSGRTFAVYRNHEVLLVKNAEQARNPDL